MEKQGHELRHGKEKRVLGRLADLRAGRGLDGEAIRREQNYFVNHAGRLNYQEVAACGWPIGSGVVESACAQKQGRLKRPGQFWSPGGSRHLDALIEARDNGYRDELWLSA